MKIKRLDLLAFGPFTNKSLDLSEGKPGLHVVQGPNEAGKSSTLRALKAWLFGIDARSTDNFVHDNKQLRVGGLLETSGGKEIACVRRKGNKDTLLNADTDRPIGDDTLNKLLPGLDEKLFSQLHGIDLAGLVQGGKAILEQSGDLGKSLFGAALGTLGKTDLLGNLGSEADKLFKSKGQNQIINTAAAKLKETRREEKDGSVSVREWKELQKSLKEAEETVAKIDEEIAESRRKKSKRERFRRVAGSLAERHGLLERVETLGEVVLLPEDIGSRRKATIDKLSLAKERLQKSSTKLERVQKEAGELDIPQGLLENQAAIEDLQLQLGAYQKSVKDKPSQDAKRRDHRNAAKELLISIRPDLNLESVNFLKPLLNRKKLITSLAQQLSLLKQNSGQLDTNQRNLSYEIARLKEQLEAMSVPGKDVASLKAVILAARKDGDIGKRLKKAREEARQQEETCSRELSRLGRFEGNLQELAKLALPERAVLDSFKKKFEELDDQVREIHRRQAGAMQELEQQQESLKSLLLLSQVPTLEDLQSARDHREQGWKLIRSKYMDGNDLGTASTKYADSMDLPGAYEQAVQTADEVADRLRLDAQRVQERASLESQIQVRNGLLSKLGPKLTELAVSRDQLENGWQSIWKGIANKIGSPEEMKEWLQRVEQLLQKANHLDKAMADVRSLESIQTSHINALNAELENLGKNRKHREEELESHLAHCELIVNQQEAATKNQGEIKASLVKLELQLKGALEAHRQALEEIQRWGVAWAEGVDGLGLGTNPQPEHALTTMEKLDELFEELKEADSANKRIYGMEKDEERFTAAVTQLAQKITIDIPEQTPEEVTKCMVNRLGKAKADAASLQNLRVQTRELDEEIAEARQDIQIAEQYLGGLLAEAGVSTDEELLAVIDRSQQKRQLVSRLDSLQQQLHLSGEGLKIEELEKESLELDADRVGDELLHLDARLSELSRMRDEKRDQRKALLVQIQALDGSSRAADAAERAEQLLAGIIPSTEQYLRLAIAKLILEEQVERYRQDNQTPVLRRAGELFAKLTLGSFSGLRDEVDDQGKPVLIGVRRDKEEVDIDEMSEGTRDQLFLALRLATLELKRGQEDPIPFVVDDILVGFDDDRTKACLEVLADFAQKTQVLVFTHHSMVAESAKELGKEKGVFVHELAGSSS